MSDTDFPASLDIPRDRWSQRADPLDRVLLRSQEDPETGCWVFQGALSGKGYAQVRIGGGKKTAAHRVTWEFFRSEIPAGLTFDHLCRVKACVNPWHGDLVPSAINSRRAPGNIARLNAEKTHCPQSHPLSGDNLRYASSGYGRVCRTCRAKASREYRVRQKEMVS